MFKRALVLGSALAAVSALAFPALSSANWTDGTVNIESEKNISTAGNLGFSGSFGGVICSEATGTGVLEPGTTGRITSSVATISTCTTSGGLAGCKVTSVTPTGLPWIAHTNGSTITTTDVHLDITLHGAFCPYHEITLKGATTITPNNTHAAGTGSAGGTVPAYNGTTGALIGNVNGTGNGNITPAETYGLT